MLLKSNLFISKKEIKAAARFKDALDASVVAIAEAFGKSIEMPELSSIEKAKILLGMNVSRGINFNKNGVSFALNATVSKKGISIDIEISSAPELLEEIMSAYADMINIALPAVTSAVTGIVAANALMNKRADEAAKRISKL